VLVRGARGGRGGGGKRDPLSKMMPFGYALQPCEIAFTAHAYSYTCMYIHAGIHAHACYVNIVVAVVAAVVPRLALNARNLIFSDALLQHVAMLLNRQNLAAPI
jgi:hypothetical protein